MMIPCRVSGPVVCVLLPLLALQAQEPRANIGGRGARGEAAAIAGAKEDPVAVERGTKLYSAHCAGCHGNTGRGNPGAPDLIRSIIVLTDEKGILISPVLRDGRPDQGMPKPNLTEPQIADLVAWLHVQTYAGFTHNGQNISAFEPSGGRILWHSTLMAAPSAGPITYTVDGRQYLPSRRYAN